MKYLKKLRYKLHVCYQILTRDELILIDTRPPHTPFTLRVGNIEVIYHDPSDQPKGDTLLP